MTSLAAGSRPVSARPARHRVAAPAASPAPGGEACLAAVSPAAHLRNLPKPTLHEAGSPLTASEIDRLSERIEAFLLDWLILAPAGYRRGES